MKRGAVYSVCSFFLVKNWVKLADQNGMEGYELRIPEKLKTYSEYITESRLVVVYIEKDGPRRHSGDGGLAERDVK